MIHLQGLRGSLCHKTGRHTPAQAYVICMIQLSLVCTELCVQSESEVFSSSLSDGEVLLRGPVQGVLRFRLRRRQPPRLAIGRHKRLITETLVGLLWADALNTCGRPALAVHTCRPCASKL